MEDKELNIQNKALDIELLKIYYEEWKFRQESLWKRMPLFFVIIFFVSTLPITACMFNDLNISGILPEFFPACGLILSILYLWYCFAESYRINAIDDLIKEIVNANFPSHYTKNGLHSFVNQRNKAKKEPWKIFTWRMAIWVPLVLTAFEVIVAIVMLFLIRKNVI